MTSQITIQNAQFSEVPLGTKEPQVNNIGHILPDQLNISSNNSQDEQSSPDIIKGTFNQTFDKHENVESPRQNQEIDQKDFKFLNNSFETHLEKDNQEL